jgi:hypothetical protein
MPPPETSETYPAGKKSFFLENIFYRKENRLVIGLAVFFYPYDLYNANAPFLQGQHPIHTPFFLWYTI